MFAQMLGLPEPKQSSNADYDDGNRPLTELNEYSTLICNRYSLKATEDDIDEVKIDLIEIHQC